MEFYEIYNDLNIGDLEKNMQDIFPDWDFSFFELVKEVYEGKEQGLWELLFMKMKEVCYQEWNGIKNVIITLVILILIASVFHSFKDFFRNYQIAEIAFYINYLILIVVVSNLFGNILAVGENALRNIEEFMRIFFPTFYLVVGNTMGMGTGLAYYQIAGVVIYLVEWCLVAIILPSLSAYMLFVFMNGIWEEEKLALLLELFQKGIKFLLRAMLGILTGAGMIQSMIVPIIDRIKGETLYKAVESIPGIGEVTEGALRIWLGSAVLIKNSIGIVGCIVLVILCLIPMIKILLVGSMLKITAAILSLVGDKKMIGYTNQAGDVVFMIFQTVGYGMLLFMVLVAITICSTNGGF